MKRIVFWLLLFLLIGGAARAQTHRSEFGFVVNLAPGWEVIGKAEMARDPNMLDTAMGVAQRGALKDVDQDMLGQLKAMVITGNVEYYFHNETRSLISVLRRSGKIVELPSEVGKTCATLSSDLTKLMGRPTKVYECELRRMQNFNAFYTVADSFKEETKSLQYQIQKSPKEVLIITATCQNQFCKGADKDFDQMVNSLKLDY